ncbi:helix-turn-helix transcriptional regulator [Capnocytophaga cynodegmi]|uniref:Uncharacterized protein n=1 Tax=Capnocytophaga cynodegmi TaxID=28189 RepID=A0A0B7HM05_9FLAO|nr:WYL domain-containing protein [Capnocytophaga cynodegmi]CEN40766.1 conserved hypothetical protein [Capnocytophaga cynodegmi]CEN40950.1 conserved hypothetical protein [Capnocytophaga cynodegmi]
MATNKNALIRYKTIDECLRNTGRRWTLEDLINACSDALYEYEGKDDMVSKRTIQLDIQNMRSDKMGYNAPIEVFENKYYRYSDPDYSIKNTPISQNDIKLMGDAIQLLKEFKDFSFFKDMNGIIHRLEDSVFGKDSQNSTIIHLDKNELLKGLEYIDPVYRAIQRKKVLEIDYKSFKSRRVNVLEVHPQFLKEFNNRWFVVCHHKTTLLTLALDRIENLKEVDTKYISRNLNPDEYFKDIVGVTVSEGNPVEEVVFFIDKENANYVKTKPFHHSQIVLEEKENGTIFKIKVRHNFELERLFLGFGNSIEVISPCRFRRKILSVLKKAIENYSSENQ